MAQDTGKRNFISMLVEGGFYFTGYTFFDVYIVIPVFVYSMTNDLKLSGLAVAIKVSFFILPQLIMGLYTSRIKNVPGFLGIVGLAGRLTFFMVPAFLLTGLSAYIKISVLIFALAAGSFSDGLTHVPWLDMMGRTIPPYRRGKLMGYQMILGGIGGFGAGILIKYILSGQGTLETRYSLIFLVGAVIMSIAGALLFTLKDNERPVLKQNINIRDFFGSLHVYFRKHPMYRKLILTQSIAGMSALASPLYILFAKNHFALDQAQVSTLMLSQIAGSLFAGLIWGNMGQLKSNRFTIQAGILTNIFTVALAVFLNYSDMEKPFLLLTVLVFAAGVLLGNYIGYLNYLMDIISEKERPVYISLTYTILFPLTLVPLLGGFLADTAGFMTVFFVVFVFCVTAYVTSFRLSSKT